MVALVVVVFVHTSNMYGEAGLLWSSLGLHYNQIGVYGVSGRVHRLRLVKETKIIILIPYGTPSGESITVSQLVAALDCREINGGRTSN